MAASAQSVRGPSVPQSRVGGYRIIRKLAVGGMAEIFLARLEAAHGFTKQVVLKRLLPHLCEDPSFVAMFLHEARLAAGLSHPNIAQVFDIGESEGRLHYAMEYVHGPDLRDVAKRIHARGQTPPLDLVIGVCIGVAAGLHYAHTARDDAGRDLAIVHRDVTPSNVVVTYGGVAKLLDFGVAKAQLDDRESTAVGVLKGKLPYMSPEQIECTSALDGRSDVFSLGVMLWELSTLHRLYRCGSPAETVRRITSEDAPPPSSVCDDYPPALEAIVLRALARDREQRYASAFELQRALELFALDHQLVTSGSRIAELMAELFADELEDERARLEAEPREVTDSEVFTANWRTTHRDPDRVDGHDDSDAPTRLSEVMPAPVSVLVPPLAELPRDAAQRSSPRWPRWPWIVGAVGSALVVALAWKAFGSSVPVEPTPTASNPVAAPASEASEPISKSSPPPGPVAPAPQAEPTPEPTPTTPNKPSKRKRSTTKSSSKAPAEWNKNSLALPE